MPEFDVERERINVFRIDDDHLFVHFFDRTDLFEAFREYYNDDAYRFEIPEGEFDEVRGRLTAEYFNPVVIEDPEPYCVVKEKYTKHADILRNSVVNWERRGHRFFIMKDELAVKEALERGPQRLEETDFVLGI